MESASDVEAPAVRWTACAQGCLFVGSVVHGVGCGGYYEPHASRACNLRAGAVADRRCGDLFCAAAVRHRGAVGHDDAVRLSVRRLAGDECSAGVLPVLRLGRQRDRAGPDEDGRHASHRLGPRRRHIAARLVGDHRSFLRRIRSRLSHGDSGDAAVQCCGWRVAGLFDRCDSRRCVSGSRSGDGSRKAQEHVARRGAGRRIVGPCPGGGRTASDQSISGHANGRTAICIHCAGRSGPRIGMRRLSLPEPANIACRRSSGALRRPRSSPGPAATVGFAVVGAAMPFLRFMCGRSFAAPKRGSRMCRPGGLPSVAR